MRIGIDIRHLGFLNDSAGIFQYTRRLVESLIRVAPENDYALLSCYRGAGDLGVDARYIRRIPGRVSGLFLERLGLPLEALLGRLDVFHGPYFGVPRALFSRTVATIHDLMPLDRPEFLRPDWAESLKGKILKAAKRADAFIAVSEYTKAEAVSLLGIPEGLIRVVYNGVAPIFRKVEDSGAIEGVKKRHGIEGRYLLFVGSAEPKKNLGRLLEAFSALTRSNAYRGRLVIAGCRSWGSDSLKNRAEALGVGKSVIFTGIVEDAELPALYSGADLFVFPSLFEGFGIPVLEAMACGTPVAASNATSIPEIAGGCAVLFDPLSADSIAGAIEKVLKDERLARDLREKGQKRARDFTWERTAEETLRFYSEIL